MNTKIMILAIIKVAITQTISQSLILQIVKELFSIERPILM